MLGSNKTQEHKFFQQLELSDAEMEKLSGGIVDVIVDVYDRAYGRRWYY